MKGTLVVAACGLCALLLSCAHGGRTDGPSLPRPPGAAVQQIRHLEEVEWGRASQQKDTAWFERHLADEVVFTTGRTGRVTTKAQEMADILAQSSGGGEDRVDELRVQVHGVTAVATFKLDTRGSDRNGPYHRVARYTEVWIYRDGRWQLLASHSSLIPQAAQVSP